MAIDLATEVDFTPKPGSFLFGIDSDQFPEGPVEIMLGDTAPVPAEAALAAGLLRTAAAAERRGRPGSRAPCRSVPACPRAPPSRWRCCSPSATTPIPWHWPATARRPSAARAPTSACSIPLAIAGATAGHALHIDFADLETPSGGRSRGGGLRDRPQRGAPPPHRHPLRRPARRVRACGAHSGPAARPLRARRPQRAHRSRPAPAGPSRHHRVRAGGRGRAAAGPGQPERAGRRHDRGAPQPGRATTGSRCRRSTNWSSTSSTCPGSSGPA